jgi:hypothetical protein
MRRSFWFLVIIMLGTLIFVFSCPPQPPAAPVAEYGDAPDSMDAGYYAPQSGGVPGVIRWGGTGTQARFPTVWEDGLTDSIFGPFARDVDDFWIGRFLGMANPADIPSVELDAIDPADPDGPPNLNRPWQTTPPLQGRADCDRENGGHNPQATGCRPVPPFTIPMNGWLVILAANPPIAWFITSVTANTTLTMEGPAHWNTLFDLNQSGEWDGPGEWISQDVPFNLMPGRPTLLVTRGFQWPSSGTPFGRLIFPIWMRNMATVERVQDVVGMADWDGRGTRDGFTVGEVEDYFLEWRPIGQMLENQAAEGEEQDTATADGLVGFACPAGLEGGGMCELTGPAAAVWVACVPDGDRGGPAAGAVRLTPDEPSGAACETERFSVFAQLEGAAVMLEVGAAPDGASVIFWAEPDDETIRGAGPIGVTGGVMVPVGG